MVYNNDKLKIRNSSESNEIDIEGWFINLESDTNV